MKKIKKYLFISIFILTLMASIIVSGVFNISASAEEITASGTCGDNLTWSFGTSTGVLTISGTGRMANYYADDHEYSPWRSYREIITTVIISEGVTTVGSDAFYECSNLTSVTLPQGVTSIGSNAFYRCGKLININIPYGVTSISTWAFGYCYNLTSISIPSSVTDIGHYVFSGCSRLTKIIYCGTIQQWKAVNKHTNRFYTDQFQFHNIINEICTVCGHIHDESDILTEEIPQSNYTWSLDFTTGKLLISGSGSMPNYGEFSSSYSPWYGYTDFIKTVTISKNCTTIGQYAFYGCTQLTTVNLEEECQLISVGSNAFENCRKLTGITFPSGLDHIEEEAFYGCTNFTNVVIPNSVISIGKNAFYGCTSLKYNEYDNAYYLGNESNPYFILVKAKSTDIISCSIHNNTRFILWQAFYGCSNLKSVTIPDNVTNIGAYAFYCCSNLKSVIIFDGVTTIDSYAFYDCHNLKDVYYTGSDSDKQLISISDNNECLNDATWYFDRCVYDPELGHDYDDACDEICNACGVARTVPHDYVWVIDRENNCGIDGIKHEECSMCHTKRNENTVLFATGEHSYEWIVDKENNCGIDGIKHEECSMCHTKRNENTVLFATGKHTYTDSSDKVCNICNHERFYVSYNFNGGSNGPENEWSEVTSFTIGNQKPEKYGYIFMGWNTLTDNNTIYQPRETVSFTEDLTLYAVWVKGCSKCDHTGELSNECAECQGTAKVTEKIDCHFCLHDGYTYTCTTCGSHNILAPYGICARCSGSMNRTKCSNCDAGYSLSVEQCSNCRAGKCYYDCDICSGAGYLKEAAPTVTSFNDTKVTLLLKDGYEYSIDGINWQRSNVFTGLSCATTYTFYQRVAATDYLPFGYISEGVSVTTAKGEQYEAPSAPTVSSATSNSITLVEVAGCEYSKDGLIWQKSTEFMGLSPATEYTFYQRYAETDTFLASPAGAPTYILTDKGIQSAPAAPTLSRVTSDTVVLTLVDGIEYSMDGVNWQISNTFANLESKTYYYFYQRYAENETFYASDSSAVLLVKTNELCNHSYTNYVSNNDATCTEDGTKTAKCDWCDETSTITDAGSVLGHDIVHHEAQAPTCTESGWDAYDACSRCDYSTKLEISATGHSASDWIIDTEATCENNGSKHKECTVCHTILEESGIPMLAHSYVSVVTNPTCTEEGFTTHTCSECGNSYVSNFVAALGHNYGEWKEITSATCINEGKDERECSVCHSKETRVVSANGHIEADAVIENRVDPDCTTDGKYDSVIYCSVCRAEISREINTLNKLGHNYKDMWSSDEINHWNDCSCGAKSNISEHLWNDGEIIKEPTGELMGIKLYTCMICNRISSESVEKIPEQNDTSDVSDTPETSEDASGDNDGLSAGAVVGIATGSTVVVGTGGFSLFWFAIKKRKFADLVKIISKK